MSRNSPYVHDRKRLDWLQSGGHQTFEFIPQAVGGVYVFGHYAEATGGSARTGVYYKQLRAAIDAAMKHDQLSEDKPTKGTP